MIGVGSALVSLLLIFVCYSLTLTAKRADENLLMICEKNQKNEEERGNREMESQRDILRVIEKEIKKGSAPVAFAGLGFSEECYHLVDTIIRRIRKKIEPDSAKPRYILNVWGMGYKFNGELMK